MLYEVLVADKDKASVRRIDPPSALSGFRLAAFRALDTVLSQQTGEPPPDGVNPAVLPWTVNGKMVLVVYLLMASKTAGVIPVAGHRAFVVSADGRETLAERPLSRTRGFADSRNTGGEVRAVVVGHVVSSAPRESHVFLSLTYNLPLVVETDRGTWWVEGPRIEYWGHAKVPGAL